MDFGFGYQQAATPTQVSGWAKFCHATTTLSFAGLNLPTSLCSLTLYSPGVTSTFAATDIQLWNYKTVAVYGEAAEGAAVSAQGIGGATDLGGGVLWDVSKIVKMTGIRLSANFSWNKANVTAVIQQPSATAQQLLMGLATKTAFRFGIGRTW